MIKRRLISNAVHAADGDNEERVRNCSRCQDMFGVVARLGPRIMPIDEVTGKPKAKPSDYDFWLECRNCGTVFAKNESKIEPELEPIKEPSDGRRTKITGTGHKKKAKGKGNNPRLKNKRNEIRDADLLRELKDGAVCYLIRHPTRFNSLITD